MFAVQRVVKNLGRMVPLALLGLLAGGCGEENSVATKQFEAELDALPTEVVVATEVTRETEFDGVIQAVNQAVVSAQTSGRIVALPFDVGDYVAKGDVIASFTDTEQQAAVAAARAQQEEAEAHFAEADKQAKRVADVYAKGLVAKSAYDQAIAAQQAAAARVESAAASLRDARERLAHTRVVAPYSGIVVKRLTDVGAAVSPGSPLLEGLSLDHLRVQVDIPQQHIGPLRTNKKARVILSGGESVEPTEMRIPPSANPATHSFSVLMTLPEGPHTEPVFPGTLVKVAFVSSHQPGLLIPAKAVANRGEVTGVYVLTDTSVEFRYVRPGRKVDGDRIAILAGLEEGERVVLDPIAAAVAYKTQVYREAQP